MAEFNVLYGRHAVLEAIQTEQDIEKIFILQSPRPFEGLGRIRKTAELNGIPVLFAPREKLDQISGSRDHQGVVAVISSHSYADLDEILKASERNKKLLIALDHIEDPQNLGSILRTCDAVGACGVLLPKRRSAGLSPGAAKASAGAIQHVKVARVPNLHQALLGLKREDFTIIGASQDSPKDYHQMIYPDRVVLVLGNEHKGLSFLINNTCDDLVKIPMQGHLDSLNVSVAGALILYQIFHQWKAG